MENLNKDSVYPVGDRTLIEILDGDKQSASGLELSNDNNRQVPVMGRVLKAGDGSRFEEGQVLLFRRYGVDELAMNFQGDEVKIFLVDDADVLAVVRSNLPKNKQEYHRANEEATGSL